MYGLVRIRFAAAITSLTAVGASSGAIARPRTMIARSAGAVGSALGSGSGSRAEIPPGVSPAQARAPGMAAIDANATRARAELMAAWKAALRTIDIDTSFVGRRG